MPSIIISISVSLADGSLKMDHENSPIVLFYLWSEVLCPLLASIHLSDSLFPNDPWNKNGPKSPTTFSTCSLVSFQNKKVSQKTSFLLSGPFFPVYLLDSSIAEKTSSFCFTKTWQLAQWAAVYSWFHSSISASVLNAPD